MGHPVAWRRRPPRPQGVSKKDGDSQRSRLPRIAGDGTTMGALGSTKACRPVRWRRDRRGVASRHASGGRIVLTVESEPPPGTAGRPPLPINRLPADVWLQLRERQRQLPLARLRRRSDWYAISLNEQRAVLRTAERHGLGDAERYSPPDITWTRFDAERRTQSQRSSRPLGRTGLAFLALATTWSGGGDD
jgi:hypothetical protein